MHDELLAALPAQAHLLVQVHHVYPCVGAKSQSAFAGELWTALKPSMEAWMLPSWFRPIQVITSSETWQAMCIICMWLAHRFLCAHS